MDTVTTPRAPVPASLPWPSLLVLSALTFVVVTSEMLPTAVLPQMSADLGVSEARTGMLVSLWAGTVVLTTIPLVRLTARFDRRTLASAAMLVLAASGVVTALAPTYPVALAGRLLGAVVTGLLWATVNAHSVAIVPEQRYGRAIAVVLAGGTLGTVLGVPVAAALARTWDWRGAVLLLAAAALVVAIAVRAVVVAAPAGGAAPAAAEGGQVETRTAAEVATDRQERARTLRTVLAVAGLAGLVLVGDFAVLTFVVRVLEPSGARLAGGVPGLLLLFGITSAVGIAVVGRVGDTRPARAMVTAAGGLAVVLLAVLALEAHVGVAVGVVALWGLTSGMVPPLAQTMTMRAAGTALRTVAATAMPVVMNLGIAVGAGLGSLLVAAAGTAALPVPAAVVVAVAALGLAATTGVRAEQPAQATRVPLGS